MAEQPHIKYLSIRKFRGIDLLEWRPDEQINILIGGGDSGKSTVLQAISLLFSPTNIIQIFDTDYLNRVTQDGFSIEAVVEIPTDIGIADYQQALWPWEWNGQNAVVPDPNLEGDPDQPVFKFRVRGTDELELVWEVIQPNDDVVSLSVGLRRKIGVVRLANDDRNDRDLRLVSGSALDRLLSKGNLKSRINKQVSDANISDALLKDEKDALARLGGVLREAGLPHDLDLGLTSSQGLSIGALIGLLANKDGVMLPLASWGAGTRRMSALAVAAATQAATRLTIIDEMERGLEPYRLRQLIAKLARDGNQCFVTTHSAVAIAAATQAALWFMDSKAKIGALARDKIANQQRRDPETFLTKVPVIAEGVTEVGFLRFLLRNAFTAQPEDHGIRVCDGGGNEAMLGLLQAFSAGGLIFAGFCDNEGKFPELWRRVGQELGPRLFQWRNGCLEENIIAHVRDDQLLSLAEEPDGAVGRRMRTIADRLAIKEKDEASILAACGNPEHRFKKLRSVIVAAATGNKDGAPDEQTGKEWAKHGQTWFKSVRGGAELANKMKVLSVWPKVEPEMLPFINALRFTIGQQPLGLGALQL
jgi:putative ATP-dependent endonuclease of the OLD family